MDKIKITMLTELGTEKTCVKDVKEYLGVDSEIFEEHISFEIDNNTKNLEALFKFSVLAQSVNKIIIHIGEFEFKDENDVKKNIKSIVKNDVCKYWFDENPTFHVRCDHDNDDFTSGDIEPEIGAIIIDQFPELEVSMKSPDLKVLLYIQNYKVIFGIDLTQNNLSKRQYKLINSGKSLRATIAHHLVREIDFKGGEILLDPNSKTAEVVIEACLWLTKMHNFYDVVFPAANSKLFKDVNTDKIMQKIKLDAKKNLAKLKKTKYVFAYSDLLRDLNAGKANAKVAGVLDLIQFSKVSLDWVDSKFDKGTVDKIITFMPSASKHMAVKQVKKVYSEFLYQADYIIKPKGKIGVLIQRPDDLLELMSQKQKALKLLNSDTITIGELTYTYLIISK